jgi:hypothetical protein
MMSQPIVQLANAIQPCLDLSALNVATGEDFDQMIPP